MIEDLENSELKFLYMELDVLIFVFERLLLRSIKLFKIVFKNLLGTFSSL